MPVVIALDGNATPYVLWGLFKCPEPGCYALLELGIYEPPHFQFKSDYMCRDKQSASQ